MGPVYSDGNEKVTPNSHMTFCVKSISVKWEQKILLSVFRRVKTIGCPQQVQILRLPSAPLMHTPNLPLTLGFESYWFCKVCRVYKIPKGEKKKVVHSGTPLWGTVDLRCCYVVLYHCCRHCLIVFNCSFHFYCFTTSKLWLTLCLWEFCVSFNIGRHPKALV